MLLEVGQELWSSNWAVLVNIIWAMWHLGREQGERGVISLPVHTVPLCAVSQWLLYGRVSFVINELLSASLENPPWVSPNNIHLLHNSCFWLSDFGCNQTLRWKHGKAMDGFGLGCIKRTVAVWKPTSVCLVLITLVQGNYYSKIVNLLQIQ